MRGSSIAFATFGAGSFYPASCNGQPFEQQPPTALSLSGKNAPPLSSYSGSVNPSATGAESILSYAPESTPPSAATISVTPTECLHPITSAIRHPAVDSRHSAVISATAIPSPSAAGYVSNGTAWVPIEEIHAVPEDAVPVDAELSARIKRWLDNAEGWLDSQPRVIQFVLYCGVCVIIVAIFCAAERYGLRVYRFAMTTELMKRLRGDRDDEEAAIGKPNTPSIVISPPKEDQVSVNSSSGQSER